MDSKVKAYLTGKELKDTNNIEFLGLLTFFLNFLKHLLLNCECLICSSVSMYFLGKHYVFELFLYFKHSLKLY